MNAAIPRDTLLDQLRRAQIALDAVATGLFPDALDDLCWHFRPYDLSIDLMQVPVGWAPTPEDLLRLLDAGVRKVVVSYAADAPDRVWVYLSRGWTETSNA